MNKKEIVHIEFVDGTKEKYELHANFIYNVRENLIVKNTILCLTLHDKQELFLPTNNIKFFFTKIQEIKEIDLKGEKNE